MTMSIARYLVTSLIFTVAFAGTITAQKAKPKGTAAKTSTAKTVTKLPPLDVRAARVKVSNQYSNVNQFINIMGPIAESIEALDAEARTKKISQSSIDINLSNKQKLLTAIKNMRAGIDALETEFETKPALKPYLLKIQGISDLAAQSEELAFTGKFVGARDPWRTIAQKLNDTLTAMPNAEL
jgi:hypothetical protein